MKQSERMDARAGALIKVFLTSDEMTRFEAFLEVRGAKKGPFARQLILRAMAEGEGKGDGSTQARELADSIEEARK